MLSISKIQASAEVAARYYKPGSYYAQAGGDLSRWAGKGAERLGLKGCVALPVLENILSGKLPSGHTAGWENQHEEKHTPGWDLTFNAPKGVSIMAIIGDDRRLIRAHRKAVEKALAWAGDYAFVRVRNEDKTKSVRHTGNIVAAHFTEYFSRELDAHLHTHSPVANMTYDVERGSWFALHSEALFAMKMATGQVYRSELAAKVQALGYDIQTDASSGLFDIRQIPEALLKLNSKRRQAIIKHAREKGWASAGEFALASILTRPNKKTVSHKAIVEGLRRQAGPHLFDIATLKANALEDTKTRKPQPEKVRQAVRLGLAHLANREAVFEHGHAVQEALKTDMGTVTVDEVETALPLRKGPHQYLPTDHQTGGKTLYHGRTIENSVAWEVKLANLVAGNFRTVRPLVNERKTEAVLADAPLNEEQKTAVRYILRSRDRFMSVTGVAGSGKSHMVKTATAAMPSRNFLALAPTASAAVDLGKSAGVEAMTVARFLQTGGYTLDRNSVLFVDEASMASTRQAARLLEIVEDHSARIVFIGDTQQFDAIENGKPFGMMLQMGLNGPFISKSHRQKNRPMQELVKAARIGNTAKVFRILGERIRKIDRETLAKTVAEKWINHPKRGQIQIAALDNASRIAINDHVRAHLQEEGKVSKIEARFHVLYSKGLTPAQLRQGDYYKKGDMVVFHLGHKDLDIAKDEQFHVVGEATPDQVSLKSKSTDRKITINPMKGYLRGMGLYHAHERQLSEGDSIQWRKNLPDDGKVQNGHTGKVQSIKGDTAVIRFDHGIQRTIDLKEHPYWDHAYAITTYKQQGKTTPVNWIVALTSNVREITQKTLHVSLTRAEYSVQIFTDDKKRFRTAIENTPGGKTSALEGRGVQISFGKTRVTPRHLPDIAEGLFDRLGDRQRTKGMNLLDMIAERRRQREQSHDHHPVVTTALKRHVRDRDERAAAMSPSHEREELER